MASGVVVALVVVGGIGGLTMLAFAGVAHGTAKTTTVTRLCVYIDRSSTGDSYGDVTVTSSVQSVGAVTDVRSERHARVAGLRHRVLERRILGHDGRPEDGVHRRRDQRCLPERTGRAGVLVYRPPRG